MADDRIEVADAPEAQRYEIRFDGEPAGIAAYRRRPGVVELTHTRIDPAYEGHGLGSALARGALEDIRSRGERVVPSCPFIRGWIEQHPDYADLVTDA